jgi:hypothetical protein
LFEVLTVYKSDVGVHEESSGVAGEGYGVGDKAAGARVCGRHREKIPAMSGRVSPANTGAFRMAAFEVVAMDFDGNVGFVVAAAAATLVPRATMDPGNGLSSPLPYRHGRGELLQ